ncbi:MAG: hypothetical protein HFG97_01810 [Dorea sp.]|nr:hypothetical protein [Dorea sp.]
MYEVEYCNKPENGEIKSAHQQLDNCFCDGFHKKLKDLDRFIFLVDMHTIIESCAEDLKNIAIDDFDMFWKVNKRLLNYVNAVYGYKEYVNNYDPPLSVITESHYKQRKWYRFICDFRNYIIHQSIIIKDYRPADADIFINIEEIIDILAAYPYPNGWQRQNAENFSKWLEILKADSVPIKDSHYLSMKYIVKQVNEELSEMKEDVFRYAFDKRIKPALQWLISLMPKENGIYQYTFVVNKENLPNDVWEPNYALEDFVRRIIKYLGSDNQICKELFAMLQHEGYDYFYDGYCSLNDFVEKCSCKS